MGMRGGGGTNSYNDGGNNWDSSNRSNDRNFCKLAHILIKLIFFNIICFTDSEQRSKDSYEDEYQYDGEREDSDNETVDPPSSAK